MRGMGQTASASMSQQKQKELSTDLLCSDVATLIERVCANEKVFVLGNGVLGGIIAQTLCIRFAHLVDGLILVNALLPTLNGPVNAFVAKYNKTFANNAQFRAKCKQKGDDFVSVGCVESVTLKMEENADFKDGESESENDESEKQSAFFLRRQNKVPGTFKGDFAE